jgi:hypothetical protein
LPLLREPDLRFIEPTLRLIEAVLRLLQPSLRGPEAPCGVRE